MIEVSIEHVKPLSQGGSGAFDSKNSNAKAAHLNSPLIPPPLRLSLTPGSPKIKRDQSWKAVGIFPVEKD